MIGDGVLYECLADRRVEEVRTLVRSPLGIDRAIYRERLHDDFFDYSSVADVMAELDACFFCLGVSAAGMSESAYSRITFDLTLTAARAFADANPDGTFCYVSGEGTDSTEEGRAMWARVKGRTENAILELPLDAYMFRPGFVRPRPGKKSKTFLYRALYNILTPAYPILRRLAPTHVTTAENVGRAMLAVADTGYDKRILENPDINRLAGR